MMNDTLYNLMNQAVEESRSLKRIKDMYCDDAKAENREDCKTFWEKMQKDKENHIQELLGLIKQNLA